MHRSPKLPDENFLQDRISAVTERYERQLWESDARLAECEDIILDKDNSIRKLTAFINSLHQQLEDTTSKNHVVLAPKSDATTQTKEEHIHVGIQTEIHKTVEASVETESSHATNWSHTTQRSHATKSATCLNILPEKHFTRTLSREIGIQINNSCPITRTLQKRVLRVNIIGSRKPRMDLSKTINSSLISHKINSPPQAYSNSELNSRTLLPYYRRYDLPENVQRSNFQIGNETRCMMMADSCSSRTNSKLSIPPSYRTQPLTSSQSGPRQNEPHYISPYHSSSSSLRFPKLNEHQTIISQNDKLSALSKSCQVSTRPSPSTTLVGRSAREIEKSVFLNAAEVKAMLNGDPLSPSWY